jgi:hypothetical protein
MPIRSLWVAPLRNGGEDRVVRQGSGVHKGWRGCGKAVESEGRGGVALFFVTADSKSNVCNCRFCGTWRTGTAVQADRPDQVPVKNGLHPENFESGGIRREGVGK